MPKLVPSQKDRQIYCFIGGAFRPPNHRHWQMISYFSDLVGENGEVIVIVSNPQSSKYQNKHGFQDGHTLSTDDAVKVLEIFNDADTKRNNVTIMASEEGSPVRTIYGMVTDPETITDCDVLIGCYRDENDFKKWDRLQQHAEEKNPSVTVLDYKKFAYRRSYENFAHGMSALQRRIGDIQLSNEEDAMPSFLNKEQMEECMKTIYGENWNKEPEKEEKPENDDSKKPENESKVNESSKEPDYFEHFENYEDFVHNYMTDHNGWKVVESEFDEVWGGLIVDVKNPDGEIFRIYVPDHPLKNPKEWYADCVVNKNGIFGEESVNENKSFEFKLTDEGMTVGELMKNLEEYGKDDIIKMTSEDGKAKVEIWMAR